MSCLVDYMLLQLLMKHAPCANVSAVVVVTTEVSSRRRKQCFGATQSFSQYRLVFPV